MTSTARILTARRKLQLALTGGVLALAAFPAMAAAADSPSQPTGDQYLDSFTRVSSQANHASTSAPTGGLPFTGFDVGVVALIGIVLLAVGFAIRRFSNQGTNA